MKATEPATAVSSLHNESVLRTCLQNSPVKIAVGPSDCQVGPNPGELGNAEDQTLVWNGSTLGSSRKRKRPPASFVRAVETFLSSGCCVIDQAVLPPEFVHKALQCAKDDLTFLENRLEQCRLLALEQNDASLMASVQRIDFAELVARDGGRRCMRYNMQESPWTAPGLIYNPIVFSLVKELLGGGDVCLLYAGIMWAKPNPDPQKWHADGGHLFDHTQLPPHCINVFFPLVDLTTQNGPTEFQIGTHRHDLPGSASTITPTFPLTCRAGGAVLFDYRLQHRGGANHAASEIEDLQRPVLYLAYSKPFFRDTGNERSGRPLAPSSRPWVPRILSGLPMPIGQGFTLKDEKLVSSRADKESITPATSQSGERWILCQINVELDEGQPSVIVVHNGDVAQELAAQFCLKNSISDVFVPVLTETIQQQMDMALSSKEEVEESSGN